MQVRIGHRRRTVSELGSLFEAPRFRCCRFCQESVDHRSISHLRSRCVLRARATLRWQWHAERDALPPTRREILRAGRRQPGDSCSKTRHTLCIFPGRINQTIVRSRLKNVEFEYVRPKTVFGTGGTKIPVRIEWPVCIKVRYGRELTPSSFELILLLLGNRIFDRHR